LGASTISAIRQVIHQCVNSDKVSMSILVQVTGSDDVMGEMKQVLECFKDWLDAGAGGATNWRLEPENYEGWRVSVDEGKRSELSIGKAKLERECDRLLKPTGRYWKYRVIPKTTRTGAPPSMKVRRRQLHCAGAACRIVAQARASGAGRCCRRRCARCWCSGL